MREDRLRRVEAMLPKDRVCPYCEDQKLRSRQWVLTDVFVGCLSCWRTMGKPRGTKPLVSELCPKSFERVCEQCLAVIHDVSLWDGRLQLCRGCSTGDNDADKL